jgi:hypothetical protein
MYKSLTAKAAVAAVALTVGTAAQAASTIVINATDVGVAAVADVDRGTDVLINENILATSGVDSTFFNVTALSDLIFSSILLEASGFQDGNDINALEISFSVAGGPATISTFTLDGASAGTITQGSAVFAPPPIRVSAGDELSFFISEVGGGAIVQPVAVDLLLTTAAVPVPAAGVLMLGLMAAGGVAAHRRNRRKALAA